MDYLLGFRTDLTSGIGLKVQNLRKRGSYKELDYFG